MTRKQQLITLLVILAVVAVGVAMFHAPLVHLLILAHGCATGGG